MRILQELRKLTELVVAKRCTEEDLKRAFIHILCNDGHLPPRREKRTQRQQSFTLLNLLGKFDACVKKGIFTEDELIRSLSTLHQMGGKVPLELSKKEQTSRISK